MAARSIASTVLALSISMPATAGLDSSTRADRPAAKLGLDKKNVKAAPGFKKAPRNKKNATSQGCYGDCMSEGGGCQAVGGYCEIDDDCSPTVNTGSDCNTPNGMVCVKPKKGDPNYIAGYSTCQMQ